MGDKRGRRLEGEAKQEGIKLVDEAVSIGCRKKIACNDLGIDFKTLNRWKDNIVDQRHGHLKGPANKLSINVKGEIVKTANSKEFSDDSPWQIVAKLADRGEYIASESSFYKTLKERNLLVHRGKSKVPEEKRPAHYILRVRSF